MNPELQSKLDSLQKQIDDIRKAQSLEFAQSIRKRVVQEYAKQKTPIITSTINQSIGATDAFDSPLPFDKEFVLEVNGQLIKIGGYNV